MAAAQTPGMQAMPSPHALPPLVRTNSPAMGSSAPEAERSVQASVAQYVLKGEDAHLVSESLELEPGRTVHVYAVFDGHGGPLAARYCAASFVKHFQHAYCLPAATRAEHVARLERACRDAFVALDAGFLKSHPSSHDGTTATVAIIDTEHVTVANVGDSTARLLALASDPAKPAFGFLASGDHRIERRSPEEETRLLAAGAQIGRVMGSGGKPVGPERLFPGALSVSRSIGDADAGRAAAAEPEVHTHSFPRNGGVLVLATDGLWDFVDDRATDRICKLACVRGLGAPWLAKALIQKVRECNAANDDATLIAVGLGHALVSPAARPVSGRSTIGERVKSFFKLSGSGGAKLNSGNDGGSAHGGSTHSLDASASLPARRAAPSEAQGGSGRGRPSFRGLRRSLPPSV